MKKSWGHKPIVLIVAMMVCFPVFLMASDLGQPGEKEKLSIHYLRDEYSKNKSYPSELEREILTALSFYPELKHTSIEFRFSKIKTTMSAMPKGIFLLKKKDKREYVIRINPGIKTKAISYKELSSNALIGVIGHELGHILDYESMKNREIVGFAVQYLQPRKRKAIEARTDMIAIHHHLGWELFQFSDYVFYRSQAPKEYLEYKEEFYFNPEQINTLLRLIPGLY